MSIQLLKKILAPLPYTLKEQVLGYARSVDVALPEIATEASVELTSELTDKIVFFAGISKIYSICSASYWAVDNACHFLEQSDVVSVRSGSTYFSRRSDFHQELKTMFHDIEQILEKENLLTFAANPSYAELLKRLADES